MQDEKTHATAKRLLEDIGYEGTCAIDRNELFGLGMATI
tara:strand:+ start:9437 stop:9553 length:117 start_codon:yes stop_codon:yes gene_type:complete